MVDATSRPLYPRERPDIRCIGGWVGPRAGLDRCGKSERRTIFFTKNVKVIILMVKVENARDQNK
jgi:hypothetical protein